MKCLAARKFYRGVSRKTFGTASLLWPRTDNCGMSLQWNVIRYSRLNSRGKIFPEAAVSSFKTAGLKSHLITPVFVAFLLILRAQSYMSYVPCASPEVSQCHKEETLAQRGWIQAPCRLDQVRKC